MRTDRIYALAAGALAISLVAVTWARDPADPDQWVLIEPYAPECPEPTSLNALDGDDGDDAAAPFHVGLDDDGEDPEQALETACDPRDAASLDAWNRHVFDFFAMNGGGGGSFASSAGTASSGSSSSQASAADDDLTDGEDSASATADATPLPTIIDDTVDAVADGQGLDDADDGFDDTPAAADTPIDDGGEVLDALTSDADGDGAAGGGSALIDVVATNPGSVSAVPAPPALVLLLGALAMLGAARKRAAG